MQRQSMKAQQASILKSVGRFEKEDDDDEDEKHRQKEVKKRKTELKSFKIYIGTYLSTLSSWLCNTKKLDNGCQDSTMAGGVKVRSAVNKNAGNT